MECKELGGRLENGKGIGHIFMHDVHMCMKFIGRQGLETLLKAFSAHLQASLYHKPISILEYLFYSLFLLETQLLYLFPYAQACHLILEPHFQLYCLIHLIDIGLCLFFYDLFTFESSWVSRSSFVLPLAGGS